MPLWWVNTFLAKSLQSCLTLCDPIDGSPTGSAIPGILQARTLEWVAISFSNAWKWKMKVKSFSHVWLFMTPWTAAYQAPPSMGFFRQEYWSGVPLPSPKLSSKHKKWGISGKRWAKTLIPGKKCQVIHKNYMQCPAIFFLLRPTVLTEETCPVMHTDSSLVTIPHFSPVGLGTPLLRD